MSIEVWLVEMLNAFFSKNLFVLCTLSFACFQIGSFMSVDGILLKARVIQTLLLVVEIDGNGKNR